MDGPLPLADVPHPLDPEPSEPEVAEPVPERESSWSKMSSRSLEEECPSLWCPSHAGLTWGRQGHRKVKQPSAHWYIITQYTTDWHLSTNPGSCERLALYGPSHNRSVLRKTRDVSQLMKGCCIF